MKIKINNWWVTATNLYLAPEVSGEICLCGKALNHPIKGEKDVITSRIVSVKGRTVKTRSGSTYVLGRIKPEFREWLKENRPEWDWRNPIMFKEEGFRND